MYVRVRALQQLEAVRMAAEVLHELSAPQSQRHAELPPRSCSRGRGPAIKQIARCGQKRSLRDGEHARELLFLRRVRCRAT